MLRTSRFFPEADDDPRVAAAYDVANAQVNELLYRRVDIEDVVSAHLLALEKAPALGFARFIVSATTPFSRDDARGAARGRGGGGAPPVPRLRGALRQARLAHVPVDRSRLRQPRRASPSSAGGRNTTSAARSTVLAAGQDFRSPLAQAVGVKGYHGGLTAGGSPRRRGFAAPGENASLTGRGALGACEQGRVGVGAGRLTIGVYCGGSRCHARLRDGEGRSIAEARARAAISTSISTPRSPTVDAQIDAACAKAGPAAADRAELALGLGLAGLSSAADARARRGALRRLSPACAPPMTRSPAVSARTAAATARW